MDRPERAEHRTWPQRLTIAALFAAGLASFAAAGGLATAQWVVSSRNLVTLSDQAPPTAPQATTEIVMPGDEPVPVEDTEPFPVVEPEARNFLITGSDNNACIDPRSPFAGAFGDRSSFGERSDTIMVWRINPAANQVAILSFPRDLYVEIPGGGRARINSAYRRDDPSLLRDTIYMNFGIGIDHFIQVDFCAFKTMVDAVGGVAVPFEYPARDTRSGLNVPQTGCFVFEGEHALAYVRSRYYEYESPPGSGNWERDGTSDLGRIARQQDFLRRTVSSILASGAYSPSVVRALIDTNADYVTIDSELTVNKMLQFAGLLQYLTPEQITSYQIEATPRQVSGNSVLVPRLETDNMQAILALFRGEARLADAPEQVLSPTTVPDTRPGPDTVTPESTVPTDSTAPDSTVPSDSTAPESTVPDSTAPPESTTTLPQVDVTENLLGISPPRDVSC